MKDKSISLLNSSLLMHWVADYEKSVALIKQAEIVLNEIGVEFNLDEEHYYVSSGENNEKIRYIQLTDSQSNTTETLEQNNSLEENINHVNDNFLKARESSLGYSKSSGSSITEKKNRKEHLIVSQMRILYSISKKAKQLAKKKNMKIQPEDDPFITKHSEKLSCLLIRTDILNYKIRVVVNGRFDWDEESFKVINLEGYKIECISFNCHESVFHIEDRRVSGEVHFSSLGLGEGKFYEQQGVKAPDRSELIILIIRKLSQEVFRLSED